MAKEPVARHRPEPTQHPRLFVVGDYLFDSTLNGVLDSADLVSELITDAILGIGLPTPGILFTGSTPANGQLTGAVAACSQTPSST
jgi:hypothetical protein